jgi:hypothetical protein
MFNKILAFLRGGTRGFNDAERKLLSFVLNVLPERDKSVLSTQLSSVSLVQRQHPGRLVVAYYRKPNRVPQLPYPGYEYCLANVSYKSGGKTKTTTLTLHDGRLMTFERDVPQATSEIESLVKVTLHPSGHKSVIEELDAEEHG